ncbi:hypothetical protein DS2_18503 [Catenovulum agarivorans DS-2]|uniref:DUF3570 domain-containing protein n=1 Tax=Catenovulum agarivorans DS-2 TaxID=1328313 RepID=W7Q899_9ALTE|nr:DUF3570 domain-containing protein [Catenovulum agarivorans]EWH08211.1 hypothetical protein DS2_18503 [Catenovulum agarivorans DS-2]
MVVTKRLLSFIQLLLITLLFSNTVKAAVLEDDKVEVLYHSYEGGGMKIDGPAVLIRKKASESFAVSAFYYADTISSASVDVMSTASPYEEERDELNLGFEYLNNKTQMTLSLRQSEEDDYLAQSVSLNVSHDTFGDLTTVQLGISYGDDEVKRNGDDNFLAQTQHYKVRAGISQILTANLIASFEVEAIANNGFLNNPYRAVRFVDEESESGVGYQPEVYPETRNSLAGKLSLRYFLPWRAAVLLSYRSFKDSWDIQASDYEILYRQPIFTDWEFELKTRQYEQTQAEFYQDLYPYRNAQNYLARDKELSEFTDTTVGASLTYIVPKAYQPFDWPAEMSVQWDRIDFDYHNFRDLQQQAPIGEEPLYQFSADVVRVFASIYF